MFFCYTWLVFLEQDNVLDCILWFCINLNFSYWFGFWQPDLIIHRWSCHGSWWIVALSYVIIILSLNKTLSLSRFYGKWNKEKTKTKPWHWNKRRKLPFVIIHYSNHTKLCIAWMFNAVIFSNRILLYTLLELLLSEFVPEIHDTLQFYKRITTQM